MGKQIEDKGLPAPPRGSSEDIQTTFRSKKYFTLALLVLLVTNFMSVRETLKQSLFEICFACQTRGGTFLYIL